MFDHYTEWKDRLDEKFSREIPPLKEPKYPVTAYS